MQNFNHILKYLPFCFLTILLGVARCSATSALARPSNPGTVIYTHPSGAQISYHSYKTQYISPPNNGEPYELDGTTFTYDEVSIQFHYLGDGAKPFSELTEQERTLITTDALKFIPQELIDQMLSSPNGWSSSSLIRAYKVTSIGTETVSIYAGTEELMKQRIKQYLQENATQTTQQPTQKPTTQTTTQPNDQNNTKKSVNVKLSAAKSVASTKVIKHTDIADTNKEIPAELAFWAGYAKPSFDNTLRFWEWTLGYNMYDRTIKTTENYSFLTGDRINTLKYAYRIKRRTTNMVPKNLSLWTNWNDGDNLEINYPGDFNYTWFGAFVDEH